MRILALSLLTYWATGIFLDHDFLLTIKSAVIPQWNWNWNFDFVFLLVALFGTTIAPYLFFWQASGEVEEEVAIGRTSIKKREGASFSEIKNMRWDVTLGMLFANITMFFIILTAAETLFANGITNIETAEQAAEALKPLVGNWAYLLFTLGIVGTGLLAIPILAGSASYAFTEALKLKGSLNLKFKQAHTFYGVIIVSTLIGLFINFIGINPIKALIYTSVINAVVAVPLLFVIMKIGNSKKIMGEFKNSWLSNIFGYLTAILMTVAVAILLISFVIR